MATSERAAQWPVSVARSPRGTVHLQRPTRLSPDLSLHLEQPSVSRNPLAAVTCRPGSDSMSPDRAVWSPPVLLAGQAAFSVPFVIVSLLITLQVFRSLLPRRPSCTASTATAHLDCSCHLPTAYPPATLHPNPHLYSLPAPPPPAKSLLQRPPPSPPHRDSFNRSAALHPLHGQRPSPLYSFDLIWCCFLLLLVALLLSPIRAAIRPTCRCILYDDSFAKEYGIFTSPDWPVPYEDNIDCLLYTFLAPAEHIVEITFDEFDVQRNEEVGCEFGDYVKLFLHLNSKGINERTHWNSVLCGKYLDIEQTHYSSSSVLIFEFHTDWRSGNNTGFRGTFRFLKKSLFRTDGQLVASTMCDYTFRHEPLLDTALNRKIHSTESVQDLLVPLPPTAPLMQQDQPPSSAVPHTAARLQLSGGTGQRGHFYSPQYPSTYPKNTRCQYRFQAQPSERVRLLFVDVSLQRLDQSCITAPDVIKVFDGPESADPLLALICGQTAYLELLSSGQELMVQFVAKSHTSSKGFKAEFAFVPLVPPSPPRLGHPWWAEPSSSKPDSPWRAPGYGGNQSLSSSTSSSASCDRWFNSNDGPNGTFTSPNFPLPYPPSTHCTYHFDGHGKERVQIEFQEFDIHRVEDQNRDCEINSDSLIAYVTSNGQNDRIEGFCGQDLPPRLMSNGHQMTVVFRTLSHNDPAARPRPPPPVAAPKLPSYPSFTGHAKAGGHNHHPPGPKAADNRANADDEDYATSEESEEHGHGADGSPGKKFYSAKKPSGGKAAAAGQPTATEEPRRLAKGFRATYRFVTNFGVETGKQDSKSVCGFVYNSSESKNGTFTSPNYPGLYPKDTECHYFFYGNATERIQIVFTHFDVEGVTPCTLETASDYVEFSNVHAGDRKLFRHCGLKHPKSVESETDYFRVTFKSNSRFDGTGFRATYAFVDTSQGSQRNQNGRKTVSTSLSSSAACTPPATLTVLCTDFLLLLLVSSYRRLLL